MQDEVPNVALIACPHYDYIILLDKQGIPPCPFKVRVLGIIRLTRHAYVIAASIYDTDDLEWIDVNVKRMPNEV